MDIRFEFLNSSEIDSFKELIKDSFSIESSYDGIKRSLYSDNVRFLCAKSEDKIVGCVMITSDFDPVKNSKSFYLDYVCVLSGYRGKKIGYKLMLEVERIAKDEKISYIEFTSNNKRVTARSLYLSLGYEIRDTSVFVKRI